MITVFRLEQKRFSGLRYTGKGAELKSGRWHLKGTRIVYAAHSRSLAALEVLVHFDAEDAPDMVMVEADIPKEVFKKRKILKASGLPAGWRSLPASHELQHIGTRWQKDNKSLILEVPSAIIPEEANFLVNPMHPDFPKVKVRNPLPFAFDSRLIG